MSFDSMLPNMKWTKVKEYQFVPGHLRKPRVLSPLRSLRVRNEVGLVPLATRKERSGLSTLGLRRWEYTIEWTVRRNVYKTKWSLDEMAFKRNGFDVHYTPILMKQFFKFLLTKCTISDLIPQCHSLGKFYPRKHVKVGHYRPSSETQFRLNLEARRLCQDCTTGHALLDIHRSLLRYVHESTIHD